MKRTPDKATRTTRTATRTATRTITALFTATLIFAGYIEGRAEPVNRQEVRTEHAATLDKITPIRITTGTAYHDSIITQDGEQWEIDTPHDGKPVKVVFWTRGTANIYDDMPVIIF